MMDLKLIYSYRTGHNVKETYYCTGKTDMSSKPVIRREQLFHGVLSPR
jgi:hypothetical protein